MGMEEPPDSGGISRKYLPQLTFDNTKSLSFSTPGPKFLVMSRKLEGTQEDSTASLASVSPFLLKKVIDNTCSGEVEFCKKIRNGTILIKTKNNVQANKLLKLCSLSPLIKVEVSEHKSLNSVRGVIYSNSLRGISNEEILSELRAQNVIKVDKILKKNSNNNNELTETGLTILTFGSVSLPEDIYIGYEKVKVRMYIPLPLKCNNCLTYGHIAKFCNSNKICPDCAGTYHTDKDNFEYCKEKKLCINCKNATNINCDHSAYDKSCPVFLKEKEIQAIISLEKVNRKTAIATFKSRHPNDTTSFASVTKSFNNSLPISRTSNDNAQIPKLDTRPIINYSELLLDTNDNTPTVSTTKPKISILPTKTSKRTRYQLKKMASAIKSDNSLSKMDFDTSDSASVEVDMS